MHLKLLNFSLTIFIHTKSIYQKYIHHIYICNFPIITNNRSEKHFWSTCQKLILNCSDFQLGNSLKINNIEIKIKGKVKKNESSFIKKCIFIKIKFQNVQKMLKYTKIQKYIKRSSSRLLAAFDWNIWEMNERKQPVEDDLKITLHVYILSFY